MQHGELIEAYYLGGKDGKVELYDMHQIDFDQAVEAHPKDWSVTRPVGKVVIDKREKKFVFPPQQPPQERAADAAYAVGSRS